jgi:hypothetical protein
MSAQSSDTIPSFYRVFFTSIDPLIGLSGAYVNFFDPDTLITSVFPSDLPYTKITPSHTLILHQMGGCFIMMPFLMVFMLRATSDIKVWKFFEAGILITDFGLFFSLWKGLEVQNRLGLEILRWEEWGTIAITGFVTIVRILFILGVGLRKSTSAVKKRA